MTDLATGGTPSAARPRISILMATYGRAALLARTLDSLSRLQALDRLNRVWVVENGARGPAEEIVRSFEGRLPLAFRFNPPPGKSRALHSVLPEVGDDLLLFLDDDVRVGPNLVEAYHAGACAAGPGHYFGGPVAVDYEQPPPDWLVPHLPLSAVGFTPFRSGKRTAGWEFLGANFAAFAGDVRRVGGFDPEVGPGAFRAGTEGNPLGVETVLQRRLLAGGCTPVAIADAMVWHWVPRERCSPAWALHRAQRNAMTRALEEFGDEHHRFGVPRWLVRSLLEALPGLALAHLTPGAETRFLRRRRFHETVGMIQAFRHMHHRRPRHPAGSVVGGRQGVVQDG